MLSQRLGYVEFREQFLVYLAILSSMDFDQVVAVDDVVAMIDGKFPSSYLSAAVKDLRDHRMVSGYETMSDPKINITPMGLEMAESYSIRLAIDIDQAIEEREASQHTERGEQLFGLNELLSIPDSVHTLVGEIRRVDHMSDLFRELDEQLKESVRYVRSDNALMAEAEGSQRLAEIEAGREVIQAEQIDTGLVKRLLYPSLTYSAKKVRDEAASATIKAALGKLAAWLATLLS